MKIVIFIANWSANCETLFTRLDTINQNVAYNVIDVMKNTKLAMKHNIRVLPTCVKLDNEELEVGRLIGLKGVEVLTDFFNQEEPA